MSRLRQEYLQKVEGMGKRKNNLILFFKLLLFACISSCKVKDNLNDLTIGNREDVLMLKDNFGLVERGEGASKYYSFAEIQLTDDAEGLHGIRFIRTYLGSVHSIKESGDLFFLKGQEQNADPFDTKTVVFQFSNGVVEKMPFDIDKKFEPIRDYFDRCKK